MENFILPIRGRIVKIGHISTSETPCHAPLRFMAIINGIKSGEGEGGGHPCPVKSDLRGVDAGSISGDTMKWAKCSMPVNEFLSQGLNDSKLLVVGGENTDEKLKQFRQKNTK